MQRAFRQVDVFTATPFMGNPVAMVLDCDGLSDAAMQRFANWTNLSETTFVLPAINPAADYCLRIFTPRFELPFAGHPTLGSAHALLDAGRATPANGKLIQQCAVGLVEIAVPDDWRDAGLSFRLPPHKLRTAPAPDALISAMRGGAPVSEPAIVDVGPKWAIAQFADEAKVRSLAPDLAALAAYDRAHGSTGLTVFAETDGSDIVVRSFAPLDGIAEDPVCGSGNGSVAAYRLEHGAMTVGSAYSASQGREVGRDGTVAVRYADDGIHVGGRCVTCVSGVVEI